MEPVKAIAEWASEHLEWLFGLPLGLLIAYILAYAFILGPRRARLSMAALASRGYAPVPSDDPLLLEAVRTTFPVYALELIEQAGRRSSGSPSMAVVLRDPRRTRYLMYLWRHYHQTSGRLTNTQETLLVEVGATGLAREFEVSPFNPEATTHKLAPIPGCLGDDLAGLLTVYAHDPEGVRVPQGLQHALAQVAPLLREGLATKSSAGIPRQVVGLRFTPQGWALSCNPFLVDGSELTELIRIADAIGGSLRGGGV